jgi:quinohemoprotein ethanol dehydrogenase
MRVFKCVLLAAALVAAPADGHPRSPSQSNDHTNHFSPLTRINTQTVSKLGLAWSLDLEGEHTLEAVPIAADGVLYFTGQRSTVYAVDAVKGTVLWFFDPEVWKPANDYHDRLCKAQAGNVGSGIQHVLD